MTVKRQWTPRALLRLAVIVAGVAMVAFLLDAVLRGTLPRLDVEAEQATRRAAEWVGSTSERQYRAIDETYRVLQSIAGLSSLQGIEPERCRDFIASQAESHADFSNLGIIRQDGRVLCSARPVAAGVDHSARLADEARRNGLGILPNAGTDTLSFGVPVRGKTDSAVASVVFAVRALPGLDGRSAEEGGPGNMDVDLFTRSGLILAHRPDGEGLAGATLPSVPLVRGAVKRGAASGKLAGPDGVRRFYAIAPVEGPGSDRLYLAAGMPVAAVHVEAKRLLYSQIAALVLLAASLVVLAGIGNDRFLRGLFAAFAEPWPWANRIRAFWHGRPTALRPFGWPGTASKPLRRGLTEVGRRLVGNPARGGLERKIESLQRSADEMDKLSEMSQLLQTCVSIDELHGVVARFARELFPGDRGALYMINASRNLVETAVAWGEPADKSEVFLPDDCWAVRLGKPHGGNDPLAEPRCTHVVEFPPGGYLCVPMVVNGEVLGFVHLRYECPPVPGEEDWENLDRARRQLAQSFAERIALAISNLHLRESLRALSVRDPLTGLYNRRFLDEAMEIESHRAQRSHTPIGIIMIDIDNFKIFNDTYGHAAGDAMLRELGAFLHEQVREEDIPCRYGGEEFIVILPGATLEASRERAEALRHGIGGLTFDYQGKQLGPVTLSMGVACHEANGPSWQQTVKAADAALYRAKEAGRNRVKLAE